MSKLIFINSRGGIIELHGPPFHLIKVDGLGDVEAEIQTQKSPYQDGSDYIDSYLEERPITIELKIRGSDPEDLIQKRRELSAIFNPKLGLGLLQYIDETGIKEIRGVAESVPFFPSGIENRGATYQKSLIHLKCPNPFWKQVNDINESLSAWIGKFEFPFEFPVEFGEKANRATILNDGDVATPVIIDFYGPAINPTVTNETTGQKIRIKRTLSATDRLEVSTEFGNKYVEIVAADGTRTNAFHWIDLSADPILFQLELGENVISFSSDDPNSTGSVKIRYKKRYVAV
ncbi:phage tail family protein [Bacillus sp. J33]|uniref:phage tail family protein n=1 Tax=Bacillus sp. J33 TaxID=935836 RepID=UPI0004796457|nr:phage tail family protein [Bacillus sp. J33]